MKRLGWIVAVLAVVLIAGCAAGTGSDWAKAGAEPAGFFAGLWHGILLLVALIVSFFTNDVNIYEVNNTGVAYNIGFALGIFAVYGSGCSVTVKKKKGRSREKKRIFEAKIERKIEDWLDDEDEWKDLGEKIERKIKTKLRRWLTEDDDNPPTPAPPS
jgi:hypothetical protein